MFASGRDAACCCVGPPRDDKGVLKRWRDGHGEGAVGYRAGATDATKPRSKTLDSGDLTSLGAAVAAGLPSRAFRGLRLRGNCCWLMDCRGGAHLEPAPDRRTRCVRSRTPYRHLRRPSDAGHRSAPAQPRPPPRTHPRICKARPGAAVGTPPASAASACYCRLPPKKYGRSSAGCG
jgi:hypothetical protein